MDEYDDFGNYIGPGTTTSREVADEFHPSASIVGPHPDDEDVGADDFGSDDGVQMEVLDSEAAASHGFGDDVEVIYEDHDAEDPMKSSILPSADGTNRLLSARSRTEKARATHRNKPDIAHSPDFVRLLASTPALVRHVAVLGHLHHGKTSLFDLLIEQATGRSFDVRASRPRAMDSRFDEKARELSIKTKLASLPLRDSSGKHFLIHAVDTPGHPGFSDETTSGLSICDGAMLVVCAVEGVQIGTERAIESLARRGLLDSVTVCVNKMDRLIHELKLSPIDAFRKIRYILSTINDLLRRAGAKSNLASPARAGNVCFASASDGWCVSLETMALAALSATKASQVQETSDIDPDQVTRLAGRLWGDTYFEPASGTFHVESSTGRTLSFVHFVLNPIYKIYAHVLGSEPKDVRERFELNRRDMELDALPLVRSTMRKFTRKHRGGACVLVDLFTRFVPNPADAALARTEENRWSVANSESIPAGADEDWFRDALKKCDPNGPLILHAVKMYANDDNGSDDDLDEDDDPSDGVVANQAASLDASLRVLVRVYSGTLEVGSASEARSRVAVLGEAYASCGDVEDVTRGLRLQRVLSPQGGGLRAREWSGAVPCGNSVLLSGFGRHLTKTATMVDDDRLEKPSSLSAFAPLLHDNRSVCKVALEPLVPSELPKLLAGLRSIQRTYPLARTVVEDSGEHVLFGTGELFLDVVLADLRERFMRGKAEVVVADPIVSLVETVSETSSIRCFASKASYKLTTVAEPINENLARDIERSGQAHRLDESTLRAKYGFDILSSKSVWAFGPNPTDGTNVFLNDLLEDDERREAELKARDSIVQGFRWACREGPMCDEPVRGVQFRLLDLTLPAVARSTGQALIPAARKVCYASMLTATPRLSEPILSVDGLVSSNGAAFALRSCVEARRGRIFKQEKVPGTPFQRLTGQVPALDAYGLETDVRLKSKGMAFFVSSFRGWDIVPGDPLDEEIELTPLEISPPEHLARELLVKSRRRKGLSENVGVANYFDEDMLAELVRLGSGDEE